MPVKVSICIPTYNQTEFLEKNLESIIRQTYTDFEIVISDDSTTDAVETFVSIFFSKNKLRYIYLRNQTSLGSPANWNKAVSLASGEYIKIMHHDDWFSSDNSLSEFVSALNMNPSTDLAFSVTEIVNVGENKYSENKPDSTFLDKLKRDPLVLFNDNRIGAPSAVIYRAACNILFDEKISYVVDIDFYVQVLKQNPEFVFIPKPLITNTSNHENQVTASFINNIRQVGEYCYLYNKLFKGKIPSKELRTFFKSLFFWQRIESFVELEKLGYPKPKPLWIFNWLIRSAKINRNGYLGKRD